SAVSVSIKPLEDRIVVKTLEAEQTTASGLVIPDTAKEKPQEGEVLAIGPGRVDDNGNRVPLDVAVGDVVIYSKYGGTEVKYAGEEYLILSARDVLAVVQKSRTEPHAAKAPPCTRSGPSSCAPGCAWLCLAVPGCDRRSAGGGGLLGEDARALLLGQPAPDAVGLAHP